MSCLITDHRQYENVDYPPSITVPTGVDVLPNKINLVDVTSLIAADGGTPEVNLEVIVRDPNVDQTLQYRIFVNRPVTYTGSGDFDGLIMGSGTLDRTFRYAIPLSYLGLSESCKKVELLVSSQFAHGRTPVTTADIASITWFFAGTTMSTADVNMIGPSGCP